MAAGVYGMSSSKILLLGIVLNIAAGIGVGGYALVAHLFDSLQVITVVLIALIFTIGGILLSTSELQFWIFGIVMGVLVGPIQAASRSYLAHKAPPHLLNEMFGFYALSGKATSFVGPLIVAWLTLATGSQRVGVSIVLLFLLGGLGLIRSLKPD